MYSTTSHVPKPNDVPGLVSQVGATTTTPPRAQERGSLHPHRVDFNLSEKPPERALVLNHRWPSLRLDVRAKRGIRQRADAHHKGLGVDYIWAAAHHSPKLSANWARFNEGNVNSVLTSYKPSDGGLPA